MGLIKKVFGTYSDRQLGKLKKYVDYIESLAPKYKEMTNEELAGTTELLRQRLENGETLDDIVPALMDDGADITSYDDLKRFAIEKIESDELYLAEHVLKACLDVADYYGYDYSMGTLEKPTAIDGVEDLIDYVED